MGQFVTGEAARARVRALLDQVDAAHREMRELSWDQLGGAFRVEMAERLETQERVNRGLMYRVFGQIADPPDEAGAAPVLVDRLRARLRIPAREVKRRIKVAAKILPRRQLTGPPLPPLLPRAA
ncbi:MAG: HNH nuclease, partial [Dietzia sp.]|nr:HNH nuclease [Dietzia sp.]